MKGSDRYYIDGITCRYDGQPMPVANLSVSEDAAISSLGQRAVQDMTARAVVLAALDDPRRTVRTDNYSMRTRPVA